MNFIGSKLVFGGLLSAVLVAVPAGATSIGAGQFNLSGNLYINSTSILFGLYSVPPPGDQMAQLQFPSTGPFSGLTPHDTATIMNLTSLTASVPAWVVLPNGIDLDLTNIPVNSTIGVCGGGSEDAIGNTCRPNSMSPIVLTETTTGVTAKLDTMGIAYTGTSSTGSTPFVGLFSANFSGDTISALLSTYASQGYINTSYSANFTTTPSSTTVPEPGMLAGLGLGMLVLSSLRKKSGRSAK